ncbi:MAG: energy-coupled thiamine transporter ThiT [Clostridia bacterium]|nr:energy-coupled thiamine transporter ThiT [Clostridia bacterium]
MKNVSLAQKITESGLMIALATILSIIKLIDLPYGGSITLASMLPVMIIAYRYGSLWGVFTGFTYGIIQAILGSSSLSYATSWQAVVAIIALDYLFAFAAAGIAGCLKNHKNKAVGFGSGAFFACLIRYAFHVVSGCTVWAGLSIPTADALTYSLVYNATYMIPETIVTVVAAVYVAGVIDFTKPRLSTVKKESVSKTQRILSAITGLVGVAFVTALSVIVFPALQNAETGDFDITGIKNVDTTSLIITVAAAIVIITGLLITKKAIKSKKD